MSVALIGADLRAADGIGGVGLSAVAPVYEVWVNGYTKTHWQDLTDICPKRERLNLYPPIVSAVR